MFAEAEPVEDARVEPATREPATHPEIPNDAGVGPAPLETVAVWVNLVATMGPDELADFEERTFRRWERASLGDLRWAIQQRRRELARMRVHWYRIKKTYEKPRGGFLAIGPGAFTPK